MPGFFNGSGQNGVNNSIPSNVPNNKKNTTKIIGLIAVFILLVTVPVIIAFSRHPQETRQRASGVTPTSKPFNIAQYTSCGNAPADIVLIIDKSGSMTSTLGSGTTKLAAAKAAAQHFIDIIAANTNNKIGLVTFSNTAALDSSLTGNFSSVKTAIGKINANGTTCTECGAATADQEVHANARPNIKRAVILLTDGIANTIASNPNQQVAAAIAEQKAIAEIQKGYNADKTAYFTIGLGNKNGGTQDGINEPFLQKIATLTGGKYFYSPSTNDLDQIYQSISAIIGKGSISGTVFNDQNNNGALDSGEPGLDTWTVNLKDSTNTNLIATATSASDGSYSFPGVCDQSYAVSETVKAGWTQTSPPDPHYYSVIIKNGNNEVGKDFGNTQSFCGVACTTNNDCTQATDGCTVCDPGTSKCSPKISPTPSACVTPAPIKNVQIICTNCGSQ